MEITFRTILWRQYGAAIDMLDENIMACPDGLWTAAVYDDPDDPRYGQFWYVAFHTLFWLDLYLGGIYEGFSPPPPFRSRQLVDVVYTREAIRDYLLQCRQKCQSVILGMTAEQANRVCTFPFMELGFLELQIYTMRHVQEHAAQLNLFLGQHGVTGPDWIAQARDQDG